MDNFVVPPNDTITIKSGTLLSAAEGTPRLVNSHRNFSNERHPWTQITLESLKTFPKMICSCRSLWLLIKLSISGFKERQNMIIGYYALHCVNFQIEFELPNCPYSGNNFLLYSYLNAMISCIVQ